MESYSRNAEGSVYLSLNHITSRLIRNQKHKKFLSNRICVTVHSGRMRHYSPKIDEINIIMSRKCIILRAIFGSFCVIGGIACYFLKFTRDPSKSMMISSSQQKTTSPLLGM